jgi:aminopeptidase N
MQVRLNDNKKYFGMLDRWRSNILARRSDSLPIWLGYRMDTGDPRDNNYNVIVYQKGAWVVNMLRVLLLDLRTMNEDRFGAVMRDFYQQYHGRRATTADFQHVVEQHVGQSMDWFFNQWVYGCAMPTYHVAWHAEPAEGGQYKVQLRVRQEGVPPDFLMYVPVTVQTADNQFARARVKVTGTTSEITLPLMLAAEPRSLEFNDLDGVLADVKMEGW